MHYDVHAVEELLYELGIEIKQEQILAAVFENYIINEKDKIVQNTNQYISTLINSLVSNEVKGTFVNFVFILTKIIQNYFQSIEQRLFPFSLKDYYIYVDWITSRLIFVSPKHDGLFTSLTRSEPYVRIVSRSEELVSGDGSN